jgi:crotonobetainyl-CoA:carnitine CoA-transferase CaiB-like acyl-CoA transferase
MKISFNITRKMLKTDIDHINNMNMKLNIKYACSFLKGVTVLDLSRIIVGPDATMLLSDFGARVIKVEHPSGDETRRWGPPYKGDFSCYFLSINRNKESLTLNLKKPESSEIINKLVEKSDVVVENFIPGTTERLKVDYESLKKINPKLIYCSISGYGDIGPKSHEPAFDQILQGYSGYMHLSGDPEGSPYKLGFAIVDVLTGLNASNAIQAALFKRAMTG